MRTSSVAALLTDLKNRGLLDETLVVWGGEFGRTPTSENGNGRDHNHYGFTMWMTGGGVRGGMTYGETDEFGFRAVENKVHIHDLHAAAGAAAGESRKRGARPLSAVPKERQTDAGGIAAAGRSRAFPWQRTPAAHAAGRELSPLRG